jgi:polyisoprenoid-binding protein YceI
MTVVTQDLTGTFVSDPVHSSFTFAVKHMKVSTFRANFGDVDARLTADENGVSLEGRAKVESISIKNPPEFREHVVNSDEFFDGKNHPEVVFRSNRVDLEEDGTARAEGELEIKGVAKPVTATGTYEAPIEDPMGGRRTALELTATVDRRDWDMNWQMPLPKGGDVLGYDVEITVHVELIEEA